MERISTFGPIEGYPAKAPRKDLLPARCQGAGWITPSLIDSIRTITLTYLLAEDLSKAGDHRTAFVPGSRLSVQASYLTMKRMVTPLARWIGTKFGVDRLLRAGGAGASHCADRLIVGEV